MDDCVIDLGPAVTALVSRAGREGWNRRHVRLEPVIARVALDPVGSRVVASAAGHLFAYDARHGAQIGEVALGDGSEGGWAAAFAAEMAFTADGRRLVVGERRYTDDPWDTRSACSVFDATTFARERALELGPVDRGAAGGSDGAGRPQKLDPGVLAPSPDGEHIALGAESGGAVEILSMSTGHVAARVFEPGLDREPRAIVYSPDGGRLGVAWEDCAVSVVELHGGRVVAENDQIETRGEIALGFDAGGAQLVVASDADGRHESVSQVVTVKSGKVRRRLRIKGHALVPCRVDAAGGEVLWRPHTPARRAEPHWLYRQDLRAAGSLVPLAVPAVASQAVTAVAISGDGSRIAVAAGTTLTIGAIRR